MEAYLKLYDFAVHAVTSVIPEADIGPGNILSPLGAPRPGKPKWGLDIIDHAAQGTNYYTGAIGTRLTYFSCSWYDRVGLDGRVEGLSDAVDLIRNRLDRYPQFRSVPIEIAEFMVLHDVHGNRLWGGDTTEWSASWFAAVADQVYQKSITQVHLWDTTTSGVWHPQAHVIAFLEKMAGGQRLSTDVRARHANPDLVGAITVARNESIYLLVYNHAHARTVEDTLTVQLNISDPRVGQGVSWKAEQSQLDADHGVFTRKFLEDCMEAGLSPVEKGAEFDGAIRRWFGPEGVELFDQNIETYRALSNDIKLDSVKLNTNDEGEIEMEFTLPAHSVRMIRIYPER
jgi:xylan 1,4-beta-xylosidase